VLNNLCEIFLKIQTKNIWPKPKIKTVCLKKQTKKTTSLLAETKLFSIFVFTTLIPDFGYLRIFCKIKIYYANLAHQRTGGPSP
jgi:hypothetical protein